MAKLYIYSTSPSRER